MKGRPDTSIFKREGGNLAKKIKEKKKPKIIFLDMDEHVLAHDDMFMSVHDFETRRVILPKFGFEDEEEIIRCPECEGLVADEDDVCPHCGTQFEEEEDQEGPDLGIDDKEGGKDGEGFCDRECYEFNTSKDEALDDRCCVHCIKYLTLQCPHIDDFMDDVDGLDPD